MTKIPELGAAVKPATILTSLVTIGYGKIKSNPSTLILESKMMKRIFNFVCDHYWWFLAGLVIWVLIGALVAPSGTYDSGADDWESTVPSSWR